MPITTTEDYKRAADFRRYTASPYPTEDLDAEWYAHTVGGWWSTDRETISTIKHLLPTGKAWRLTTDKYLRKFFNGLSGVQVDSVNYIDHIWSDIFPQTTRQINLWEEQFGLAGLEVPVTKQERRDRLDAMWKALGGQSPRYIQDILQASGFDVYVHDWWIPDAFPMDAYYCGDEDAQCGESGVECTNAIPAARVPLDVLAPDNITPVVGKGYPLVNKITMYPNLSSESCGEDLAQCGEPEATCYNYPEFEDSNRRYATTTDPLTFPYYIYIGGQTFGDLAEVPIERQNELENLCLKMCPNQLWIGMLIKYV